MGRVKLLDPTGVVPDTDAVTVAPLASLHGRRLGFRVDWPNFDVFCDELERLLHEAYELPAITQHHPSKRSTAARTQGDREMRDFAEGVDAAIVGLAA